MFLLTILYSGNAGTNFRVTANAADKSRAARQRKA